MKLLDAQMDLLESALDEKDPRGAMVAPYKDDIVFALPNIYMGYFIPKDKLKVECKELGRMPFNLKDLDIVEESNRLVETRIEQKRGKVALMQFVFAQDATGPEVWLNARFLKNFKDYTLYQNPAKPKSLILVTEGEDHTPAGIIMPYMFKNENKNN